MPPFFACSHSSIYVATIHLPRDREKFIGMTVHLPIDAIKRATSDVLPGFDYASFDPSKAEKLFEELVKLEKEGRLVFINDPATTGSGMHSR